MIYIVTSTLCRCVCVTRILYTISLVQIVVVAGRAMRTQVAALCYLFVPVLLSYFPPTSPMHRIARIVWRLIFTRCVQLHVSHFFILPDSYRSRTVESTFVFSVLHWSFIVTMNGEYLFLCLSTCVCVEWQFAFRHGLACHIVCLMHARVC